MMRHSPPLRLRSRLRAMASGSVFASYQKSRSSWVCIFLCLSIICKSAVAATNKGISGSVAMETMPMKDVFRRVSEFVVLWFLLMVGILHILRRRARKQCYLVDYSCYKPPMERQANTELGVYFSARQAVLDPDRLGFQWRIYLRSGLGDETYVPRFFFNEEMLASLDEAQLEMEESFAAVVDELFSKTHVKPKEIDILIVAVSTFTPSPSHAAWIVNRYKMKENIKSFNLSGMGCSVNVIAVDMAKDMFTTYSDSYALVVGSENITTNADYHGTDKSFMLTNCLFRVGGYALLLSNKAKDATRAKLRLLHTVRVNAAADDEAYGCVMVKEDDQNIYGIGLRPSLIDVASKAVRKNLSILGPKVLPLSEQLYYAYNAICIKILKMKVEPYVPNFRRAFEHFCIHPGGRSVISGIGKSLKLTDYDLEPSQMSLYRFGNTSAGGVWYEMAYMEAKRRLKVGDRVVQIGLGSGFKCNTAVWEVMRKTLPAERTCWDDTIHRHPCSTRKNYTDDHCDKWFARLD